MATLTVTSKADSGAGSLRAAIALAQSGDTLQFDRSLANQTITLTSGQLAINKNLIIDGRKARGLTISGNNQHRVFDITVDPNFNPTNVTLRNLTITNGKTNGVGENGAGAGIRTASQSQLLVENSVFKNNYANGEGGAAIFAGWRSTTSVINSTFEGNSTSDQSARGGGAIAVKSESTLTVADSEFTDNLSSLGGAINVLLSGLKVTNSTFTNNTSKGYGGAIFTDGASAKSDGSTSGKIEIDTSRFEGNTGAGQGGGLFLFVYSSDQVIIESSTIINNQVIKDAKGDALGGGLRHGTGELIVRNTTFADNRALSQGGGLWVGETSPVTLYNSTFYGNRAESADGKSGLGGGITLNNGSSKTRITQTTVANNYAGFMGAGIWGGGSTTILTDTLFADNRANNGGNNWNINHHTAIVFTDGGGNFQSFNPNPKDTKITAGVTLIDPKLGAFTDNGGAVQIPPLAGNPTVTAGAIPIDGTSLTAPSDLVAKAISATQVELTWADQSNNEIGFKIERSRDRNNWTVLTTTAADITRYRDQGLTPNTPYYYRISATNGIDDSTTIVANATTGGSSPDSRNNDRATLNYNADHIFAIEGANGSAQLQFNLTKSNTKGVHEVGTFIVDDNSGRINGIAPGEEGYWQAALSNAKVIFSALPGDQFPNLSVNRQLSLEAGKAIGFYLIKDSTTDTILSDLAAGDTPDNVFFGTTSANTDDSDYLQVSELGNNNFKLSWEDGGKVDFNDLELMVKLTTSPQVLGTQLQGQPEREVIDLRDHVTGSVSAEFVVNSEASFHNSYGFYGVDNPTGAIGNLKPGDRGYAEAAVSQRLDLDVGFPAGKLVAPFLIADGTPEEFLLENPNNQEGQGVLAYFVYLGANPDGVDHIRLLGDNVFGFEDQFEGGDRDYNDLVVKVNLA